MPPVKDQAIVLRHLDYSETSQVLACLTRQHGPRRFIAKGIKRATKNKAASIIDLLEQGEVVFLVRPQSDSELSILTEWRQVDAHLGLRTNLHAWYCAQYAAEITSTMTEEADPHPELFDALAALLQSLASGTAALPAIVAYQCALLITAGVWPDLTRCVVCDRPAPDGRAGFYAPIQGGLVCRSCEPAVPGRHYVRAANLDALRSRQFDPASSAAVFELLDETVTAASGRPSSLARWVIGTVPPAAMAMPDQSSGG
jgi:DNA repair protein RecO (recombination protein O)